MVPSVSSRLWNAFVGFFCSAAIATEISLSVFQQLLGLLTSEIFLVFAFQQLCTHLAAEIGRCFIFSVAVQCLGSIRASLGCGTQVLLGAVLITLQLPWLCFVTFASDLFL
jgi:hypothetical protein